MEFINNIKWWHVVIVLLIFGLIFAIFKEKSVTQNAPSTEGFSEQETQHIVPGNEIILYYALWCGYSRQFIPEWEKFEEYAKKNLPNLRVSKVRCEDGNEPVCKEKGVEGYPTVILYLQNGEERICHEERTLSGLIKFVQQNS